MRLLGGIDDKVELNRRMNDTLETIANVIFSEWFPITDILDSTKENIALERSHPPAAKA